jgi:hypothetical protein
MSGEPNKTNWPLLFLRIAVGVLVLAMLVRAARNVLKHDLRSCAERRRWPSMAWSPGIVVLFAPTNLEPSHFLFLFQRVLALRSKRGFI